MTRKEFEDISKKFAEERIRLKSINVGDTVYVTDMWGDFFECIVEEIDLEEGIINVEDKSLINIMTNKKDRIKKLKTIEFYTKEEAEAFWKTTQYKYKPF